MLRKEHNKMILRTTLLTLIACGLSLLACSTPSTTLEATQTPAIALTSTSTATPVLTPASTFTPKPTPTPAPSSTATPTPTSTPTPLTFGAIVITGVDAMTTAPFSIPTKEWEIRWSYEPREEYSSFSFFVYTRGQTAVYPWVEWVESTNATQGMTYIYRGEGDFYLKISAYELNSYRFEIQPKS